MSGREEEPLPKVVAVSARYPHHRHHRQSHQRSRRRQHKNRPHDSRLKDSGGNNFGSLLNLWV